MYNNESLSIPEVDLLRNRTEKGAKNINYGFEPSLFEVNNLKIGNL